MKISSNYNLKPHNTFGIEAKCYLFIEFSDENELQEALTRVRKSNLPFLILGEGSNLLLTGDYEGIVLHSDIKGIEATETEDGILVKAGSGVVWDELVEHCINNGWHGLENLSYIPGTVGASAVQNIGAYGCEAKDAIYNIEAIEIETGTKHVISNSDCNYSYRHSKFKAEWKNKFVITNVTYKLSSAFTPHIDYGNIKDELTKRGYGLTPDAKQLREIIIDIRKAKLPEPEIEGNAGSFFMNPIVKRCVYENLAQSYPEMPHYTISNESEKIPAGWFIEKCGWKGRSLGKAGVHDKQALVLVNRGGATGQDILRLCNTIREDVKTKFDITIIPEVNIL